MAKIAILKKDTSKSKTPTRNAGGAEEEIRQLAYQFYVDRGYQHGFDQEDWARAEQIVKARRAS